MCIALAPSVLSYLALTTVCLSSRSVLAQTQSYIHTPRHSFSCFYTLIVVYALVEGGYKRGREKQREVPQVFACPPPRCAYPPASASASLRYIAPASSDTAPHTSPHPPCRRLRSAATQPRRWTRRMSRRGTVRSFPSTLLMLCILTSVCSP